jgi:hypothetical protein
MLPPRWWRRRMPLVGSASLEALQAWRTKSSARIFEGGSSHPNRRTKALPRPPGPPPSAGRAATALRQSCGRRSATAPGRRERETPRNPGEIHFGHLAEQTIGAEQFSPPASTRAINSSTNSSGTRGVPSDAGSAGDKPSSILFPISHQWSFQGPDSNPPRVTLSGHPSFTEDLRGPR